MKSRLFALVGILALSFIFGIPAARGAVVVPATNHSPSRAASLAGDGDWDAAFGVPGANDGVQAFAFDHHGMLYVAGSFTSIGGVAANLIARWDGHVWSSLGSGLAGGQAWVRQIVVDSHDNVY